MNPPGSVARSGPGTAQPMLIRVVIMVMIDSGNKIDTETSIFWEKKHTQKKRRNTFKHNGHKDQQKIEHVLTWSLHEISPSQSSVE